MPIFFTSNSIFFSDMYGKCSYEILESSSTQRKKKKTNILFHNLKTHFQFPERQIAVQITHVFHLLFWSLDQTSVGDGTITYDPLLRWVKPVDTKRTVSNTFGRYLVMHLLPPQGCGIRCLSVTQESSLSVTDCWYMARGAGAKVWQV